MEGAAEKKKEMKKITVGTLVAPLAQDEPVLPSLPTDPGALRFKWVPIWLGDMKAVLDIQEDGWHLRHTSKTDEYGIGWFMAPKDLTLARIETESGGS